METGLLLPRHLSTQPLRYIDPTGHNAEESSYEVDNDSDWELFDYQEGLSGDEFFYIFINSLNQILESQVRKHDDGTVTITNTYLQANGFADHRITKVYSADGELLAFFDDTAYAEKQHQRLMNALPGVASFAIGFTPADIPKDTADFIAGKDVITGDEMNRFILALTIVTPEILDKLLKCGAKNFDKLIGLIKKNGDEAGSAAIGVATKGTVKTTDDVPTGIFGKNTVGAAENYIPKNIKMANDKYLKKNGIDAHALKQDFVGKKNIAHYDLYVDKDTGMLWIYRKGGRGEPIPTYEFLK